MGRFADPYGDDNRLPEGMVWTGYDADTGERFYADRDGSTWVGAPWAEYGVLKRLKGPPQRNGPSTTRAKKQQQYLNNLSTALCPAEPSMPQGSSDLDGSDLGRTEKKRPPQRSQSVPVPVSNSGSIRREEHRGSEPGERGRTKSKKHGTRPPVDAEEGLSSSSKDKKDSDIRSRESDPTSQEPVHRSIRRSKIGTKDDASEPAGADGAAPESVHPSASTSKSTSTKRTSGDHRRSASTKEITRAHTLAARPAGQWNSETERPKASRPHSPRTSRGKTSEPEKDTRTKSSSKPSVDTDSAERKSRRLESALHPTRETKPLPETPPVSGHLNNRENSTEEKSSPENIPAVADSPARIPARKPRPILRQVTRLVRAAMSKF